MERAKNKIKKETNDKFKVKKQKNKINTLQKMIFKNKTKGGCGTSGTLTFAVNLKTNLQPPRPQNTLR